MHTFPLGSYMEMIYRDDWDGVADLMLGSAEILNRAGSEVIADYDGKRRNRKRVLARMLWQAATQGYVEFPPGPDDEKMHLPVGRDWLGIVRFLYQHIDGPPKSELDITTGGAPLVTFEWIDGDDQGTEAA